MRVEAFTSGFNEIVGFDNIRIISGVVAPPVLNIPTFANGKVTLVWTGGGALQRTSDFVELAGLAGAISPHEATVGTVAAAFFYRIRQ